MIKEYVHVAILLSCAWNIYGRCQEDFLLPLFILGAVILTFLARGKSAENQFAFFSRIPLVVIIVLSFLAGWLWRYAVPVPEETVSPFPFIIAALQSGTLFAGLLIWLKPFTKSNMYRLTFLAWLTVALSINLPFTPSILFAFCLFCIVALTTVILHTTRKPTEKKYIFLYYRNFIAFSVLLVGLSTGLFYVISKTIVVIDKAFLYFMNDYVNSENYTNFLKIDSKLSLISPGRSAWDRRPVMEIRVPNVDNVYLKMQVFEDFDNGTWQEQKNIDKRPLPQMLEPGLPQGALMMFSSFEDIVPSPRGVAAVKGNGEFLKSNEGVLYAQKPQHTRRLEFSLAEAAASFSWTPQQQRHYTALPPDIAPSLYQISSQVVGEEYDPKKKALLIRGFFRENFQYSLTVDFRGDNKGIVKMIEEQRPAYCSYFATAMTLLLRSQGIPARVAVGFLTSEKNDARNNTFLVRVNHAHAWSEALLPEVDARTGQIRYNWQGLDPTPADDRQQAIEAAGIDVRGLIEKTWLVILRAGVYLNDLDKEKLKVNIFRALVLLLFLINAPKMLAAARPLFRTLRKRVPKKRKKPDLIQSMYLRYEHHLKTAFGELRKPDDTDTEVIDRIKGRDGISLEKIAPLESFLRNYHAARFGGKSGIDLDKLLRALEQEKPEGEIKTSGHLGTNN